MFCAAVYIVILLPCPSFLYTVDPKCPLPIKYTHTIWSLHPFFTLFLFKAVGKRADLPGATPCQNGLINIQQSQLLVMQPLIISGSCSLCISHSLLYSCLPHASPRMYDTDVHHPPWGLPIVSSRKTN